jgi:hypothetical protein
MKNTYRFALFAAAFAAGSLLHAADASQAAVTVNFHESEKFTDASSRFGGETDKGYLDTLAAYVTKEAARYLAAGQRLEVTFTDIDLAGEFIPTDPRSMDIRIVKEIYMPRQTLNFRLLDADGKVVKEGERRLSDMNFMNNARLVGRNEPLFYDKALLEDWLKKELKS